MTLAPTLVGELNRALHEAMAADPRVHVLGEDILDPYGGAFKVTKGLSDRFGRERVHTTPISESAIAGVSSGMALRGLRPVAEIMFGDFLTLCADQIVNHISKWRYMFNEQVSVPLVIRTPMGGRRGYGPTHSQSLESMFMGLPAVKVLAPSRFGDPCRLLRDAIEDDSPVLFMECKTDYPRRLVTGKTADAAFTVSASGSRYPAIHLSPTQGAAQAALITYGGSAEICVDAAKILRDKHGRLVEILVLTCLHPLDLDLAVQLLEQHGRAVVVEESIQCFGWGSEVAARLTEQAFEFLEAPLGRVGSLLSPIGTARTLEDSILPSAERVAEALLETWR